MYRTNKANISVISYTTFDNWTLHTFDCSPTLRGLDFSKLSPSTPSMDFIEFRFAPVLLKGESSKFRDKLKGISLNKVISHCSLAIIAKNLSCDKTTNKPDQRTIYHDLSKKIFFIKEIIL